MKYQNFVNQIKSYRNGFCHHAKQVCKLLRVHLYAYTEQLILFLNVKNNTVRIRFIRERMFK